jgi:hypothetical protein
LTTDEIEQVQQVFEERLCHQNVPWSYTTVYLQASANKD